MLRTKQLLVLLGSVLLLSPIFCRGREYGGSGDGKTMMEGSPSSKSDYQKEMGAALRLDASFKDDTTWFKISLVQQMVDGRLGETWINVKYKNDAEEADTPKPTLYIANNRECVPRLVDLTEQYDLAEFVPSEERVEAIEMSDRAEASPGETYSRESVWIGGDEWILSKMVKAVDVIGRPVVISWGTEFKCMPLEIDTESGANILNIRFAGCFDYVSEELVGILSKRSGLPAGSFVDVPLRDDDSTYKDSENCSNVKIAVISKFEDASMLKKLFWALYSESEIGKYSPLGVCRTNMNEAFVSRMIVERFLTENKTAAMCPPCNNTWRSCVSTTERYEEAMKEYSAVLAAYKERFGFQTIGSRKRLRGEMKDRDDYTPIGEVKNWGDRFTLSKPKKDSFDRLAAYIGMMTDPKLTEARKRFRELMSTGRELTYAENRELSAVEEKLRELKAADADMKKKTRYGLCIVSMSGDIRLFESIKNQLQAAENWAMEAKSVLRGLLIAAVKAQTAELSLQNITDAMMNREAAENAMAVFRMKLRAVFGIDSDCSTQSERDRVMMAIKQAKDEIPDMMEKIINSTRAESLRVVLEKVREMTMEDEGKAFYNGLFLLMYTSDDIYDYEKIKQLISSCSAIPSSDATKVKKYLMSWIEKGDIDKLMILNMLLANKSDLTRGCGLDEFADQVLPDKEDDWDYRGDYDTDKYRDDWYGSREVKDGIGGRRWYGNKYSGQVLTNRPDNIRGRRRYTSDCAQSRRRGTYAYGTKWVPESQYDRYEMPRYYQPDDSDGFDSYGKPSEEDAWREGDMRPRGDESYLERLRYENRRDFDGFSG